MTQANETLRDGQVPVSAEHNEPSNSSNSASSPSLPGFAEQAGEQGSPATDGHSVDALPRWAQDVIHELRQENAGYRVAQREAAAAAQAAREAELAQRQQWQELAEQRGARVAELEQAVVQRDQAEAARQERENRRAACQAAGLDPEAWADRLQGETPEALNEDARRIKGLMPQPEPGSPTGPSSRRHGQGGEMTEERRKALSKRFRIPRASN